MSCEGDLERQLKDHAFKVNPTEVNDELTVITVEDLHRIIEALKADFPRKEETRITGTDSMEHCYETYDTQLIEDWFKRWFGTHE